ncbi:MAG: FAD:protein FMN transferase, partial [Phyllobacteriaceae bacterium]|nr:FAD:protein FMN transferase [Phyllobacteriaceae bacterium]
ESCMLADAWATALLVSRRDAGLALARRRGLTAFLVDTNGTSHAVPPLA